MEQTNVVAIGAAEGAEAATLETLKERLGAQCVLLERVLLDLRRPQQEGSELDAKATALTAPGTALRIRSQATYEQACDVLRQVKEMAALVTDTFAGLRSKTTEAWKLAKVHEDFYLKRLAKAEKEIKGKIVEYERERQREWDKRQAELEAKAAEKAAAEGEPADMVTARPTLQKVSGITTAEVWKCVVDDEQALRKAVLEGSAPADVLMLDYAALNRYAKAMKGLLVFPGCRAVRDSSVRAVVK